MATYKAEFLAHHYAGRLRPRSAYALGALPAAAQVVVGSGLSPAMNAITKRSRGRRLVTRLAGLEDRPLPRFAAESLQRWDARRMPPMPGVRGEVLLWPDTFTNLLHPHVGRAAVRVLEAAGWTVRIPHEPLCCGLTWISTGQLTTAKRILTRTLDHLESHVTRGGWIVGLEPSCTAVFRSDAPELLPNDARARQLAERTLTFAELLGHHTDDWTPPQVTSHPRAIVQVHCHQHATLGYDADAALLRAADVAAERLPSGCCGLAGNFGFEPGHLAVSAACAERVLLPAVRAAEPGVAILADGFSCRTQIQQLAGDDHRALHTAELLAGAL
jgi:Fe-S oxidoreductase